MAASGDVGLGWDLAGVVDALGPGVDRFKAGDAVIGMRDLLTAPIGAQAEQVVLDTGAVAPAPRNVTPVEASTIPLNSLTADQALDLLALRPGQWLLVTGAAGAWAGSRWSSPRSAGSARWPLPLPGTRSWSVGSVPTSSSPARRAWARRSAGSCPPGWTARSTPGYAGMPALDAVRDGGAFVAVAAGAAPVPLRGTRVHNVWIRTDGPRLAELAALIDAGQLTPRVAATLPLEQVAAAHERVADGGLRGRIVLTLNG